MADSFLDTVYDTSGVDDMRRLYAQWAASYDAEVARNGYVTPGRCAEALAQFSEDKTRPVLDFGCGTGLSGLALSLAGFTQIDGMDLTQEMLDQARSKGLYRRLSLSDPDGDFPVVPGDYAAIAAIGVIGAGAAPIETFHMLCRALGPGGLFVLSFNDHTLTDPAYEKQLKTAAGLRLLFEDYGDHLPGKNMKSKVYVLEKK